MPNTADFLVIGAGIAGASVAAHLAGEARVILAEAETAPGYHATGRSAALYDPTYGPPVIRALTRASHAFFVDPPEGFGDVPLLSPRNSLFVACEEDLPRLDALIARTGEHKLEVVDSLALFRLNPLLRTGYAVAGAFNTDSADIDTGRLLQGYIRTIRRGNGDVIANARVTALARKDGLWHAQTKQGAVTARVVVNAAGAWADQVGEMADAEPIGLVPKRRTALLVPPPSGLDIKRLPMTIDVNESFYLKPDAGQLLVSPANENPQPPGDAQPDEMDVAICIDRITRAFSFNVPRIACQWAGLRSFLPDRCPVIGYSNRVEGFFWLAGQGGYGIQTAPAISRFAAAQLLGLSAPRDVLDHGVDPKDLSLDRLRNARRY